MISNVTRKLVVAAVVIGGVTAARAASADYGDPGPTAVTVATNQPTAGGATSVQVAVPSGTGPFPLLVLSHGFSASLDNQIGWGKHLASYGFIAVVPSFPNTFSPNHTVNAGIIKQLVTLYSNPSTSSAAQGKVDASRVGLEGHSAGGLATALAASSATGAIVLFDPVDANDQGKTVSPSLCAPTLALFAGPSSCNNQSGWKAFVTTQSGPLTFANVVASNHCDGENAPRALCGPFCGGSGADVGRQKVYARWATAFFLAKLQNDAAAQTALGAMASDSGLAGVTSQAGTPCAPPAGDAGLDGSLPILDASVDGPRDGSSGPDGSSARPDAATSDAGEPRPSTESGCSCNAASQPSSSSPWLLAGFGLAVTLRRRLRR